MRGMSLSQAKALSQSQFLIVLPMVNTSSALSTLHFIKLSAPTELSSISRVVKSALVVVQELRHLPPCPSREPTPPPTPTFSSMSTGQFLPATRRLVDLLWSAKRLRCVCVFGYSSCLNSKSMSKRCLLHSEIGLHKLFLGLS